MHINSTMKNSITIQQMGHAKLILFFTLDTLCKLLTIQLRSLSHHLYSKKQSITLQQQFNFFD